MNLADEIRRMRSQEPIDNAEYYAITFFSLDGKNLGYSVLSNFAGFTKDKPLREIREASLIKPKILKSLYNDIGQPPLIVNNDLDRKIFVLFGGHGIIEGSIAKKYFRLFLEPHKVVSSSDPKYHMSQFQNIDSVESQKLKKAPNHKLRMRVLKRDRYRCRICGRSPDNYEDIELQLHHIRPFSQFGLTEEENLITLCHTCHKGLDPHFEWDLYELIGISGIYPSLNNNNDSLHEFIESVKRYQMLIRKKLKNENTKDNRNN